MIFCYTLFAPYKSYGANCMGIITKCQLANVTIHDKAQVWVQYEKNPERILHSTTELKHKTLTGFIGQY